MTAVPPPLPGTPTPPPVKRGFNFKEVSLDKKIPMLVLQVIALGLASLVVWMLAYSRESTNRDAVSNITKEWGGSLKILTPFVGDFHYPEFCAVDIDVETMSLHRGIYEAEVFNTTVQFKGRFDRSQLNDSSQITWLYSSDDIINLNPLIIEGQSYDWTFGNEYAYVDLPTDTLKGNLEFTTSFTARGSAWIQMHINSPAAEVTMKGEAANPSFGGDILPSSRKVKKNSFEATWNLPRAKGETIQTEFLDGVDRYQKVERSIKYALIIIILTYISVLFSEITLRKPIPLLNYFLIGAALIIFYTLLLSMAEHIPYWAAYLIAMVMTVGLITLYMYRIMDSWQVALTIFSMLTFIYIVCYILLNMSVYALLTGSLILFFALAAMMYASLKIKM